MESFFTGMKIIDMTSEIVRSYILQRQEAGYSNATVNRELAALKRMMSLGERTTPPKMQSKPYIPRLQENNARQGYYEHHEYIALKDALPDYLKSFVTMAYCTGMRKNEMLGLVWSQVDLEAGKIVLRCQETKNKESRLIYMCRELLEVIREQKAVRDRRFPETPWVFFGETGNRIKDFRGSWHKACKKVGLDGRTIHDFRRTAVRNMIRAGVPEKVAMMISGHKTRSVFDRYNIVNEEDLQMAAEKIQEKFYHNSITLDKKRSGVSITPMNLKASFLKLIQ